jgi:hypothetical protein
MQMSTCYVCSNVLAEDDKYKLRPCNHEFHAVCLIDWFRNNYTTFCPCCDNELLNVVNDFVKASRNARRRDAPKPLQRLYAKYKYLFAKYNSKEMQQFAAEHGAEFRLLRKRISGLCRKRRVLRRKIKRVKREMCEMT